MEEKTMKKTRTIFAISATIAVLASCDINKTPEFNAADSFAAFETTAYTVDENCGKLVIPVSIASIEPVKTTVTYEFVEGTAKTGVNFTDENESAVLVFDGTTRTQEIVLDIKDLPGQYTKDLTFEVKLIAAKGLNLGDSDVCSVTIADLDHPLSSILGSYTITSDTNWDGVVSYSGSILKDENDESVCWILGIAKAPFNTANFAVYGKVSEDLSTITVPLGQAFPYNSSYTTVLMACDGDYIYDGTGDVNAITLTKNEAGDFVSDYAAAFPALDSNGEAQGYFEIMLPPTTFHKN